MILSFSKHLPKTHVKRQSGDPDIAIIAKWNLQYYSGKKKKKQRKGEQQCNCGVWKNSKKNEICVSKVKTGFWKKVKRQ